MTGLHPLVAKIILENLSLCQKLNFFEGDVVRFKFKKKKKKKHVTVYCKLCFVSDKVVKL